MNRKTTLKRSNSGIIFENGIQKVNLGWENIRRVGVHSRQVNDKIILIGDDDRSFGIHMFKEFF